MRRPWLTTTLVLGLLSGPVAAQVDLDLMVEQGKEIFNHQVGCWVCHSKTGEGLIGPSLLFGPTPATAQAPSTSPGTSIALRYRTSSTTSGVA